MVEVETSGKSEVVEKFRWKMKKMSTVQRRECDSTQTPHNNIRLQELTDIIDILCARLLMLNCDLDLQLGCFEGRPIFKGKIATVQSRHQTAALKLRQALSIRCEQIALEFPNNVLLIRITQLVVLVAPSA